jgi:hypothetical protein
MRIFVNERPVDAAEGSDALSAVRQFDSALARTVEQGGGYITDGRAIRLSGNEPLSAGAILRVVVSARRGGNPADADA